MQHLVPLSHLYAALVSMLAQLWGAQGTHLKPSKNLGFWSLGANIKGRKGSATAQRVVLGSIRKVTECKPEKTRVQSSSKPSASAPDLACFDGGV